MPVLQVNNIYKDFGEVGVLKGVSFSLEQGQVLAIIGSSGSGKTTLFRILAGLEHPDSGKIIRTGRSVLLFQEDRLCEDYSAVKNVELVTGEKEGARQALSRLLPPEALDKPVC